jgi:hypothetical protein
VLLIRRLEAFSGIRVLTYPLMSNHFHLLCECLKPKNSGLNQPTGLLVASVPEPSTWSMIAVGGVALLAMMHRRKHRIAKTFFLRSIKRNIDLSSAQFGMNVRLAVM